MVKKMIMISSMQLKFWFCFHRGVVQGYTHHLAKRAPCW